MVQSMDLIMTIRKTLKTIGTNLAMGACVTIVDNTLVYTEEIGNCSVGVENVKAVFQPNKSVSQRRRSCLEKKESQ